MKVYVATEYVSDGKNAHGIYSTLEKAKEAIWERAKKQEYTPDEIANMHFNSYTYYIDEIELDTEME